MKQELNIYFRYALIILIIILAFLVIKPFLGTIILSLVLAYMSYPIYKKLKKHMNETLSALIIVTLLTIMIIVPLFFITNGLVNETLVLYKSANFESLKTILSTKFNINITEDTQYYFEDFTKNAAAYISSKISDFIFSIPTLLLNFFMMIVTIYYSLKEGDKFIKHTLDIIPIQNITKNKIVKRTAGTLESLFYGNIILAIIEGLVSMIIFYLLGVNAPIFWGMAIMLTALIPGIGAGIVWVPLALIAYLNNQPVQAILIAVLSFFIVSILIDTWWRTKMLANQTKIHPLVFLIGLFGGIIAFGAIGFILGPLILSLFQLAISIYMEIKDEAHS